MQTNRVFWFDFTVAECDIEKDILIERLKEISKKYVFQLEKGLQSGYRHYQGRLSLKSKKRLIEMIANCKWSPKIHWSVTSTVGKTKTGFNYVMKKDSRIEGPWSDRDIEKYIPRQYRNKMNSLRPFQKSIWETRHEFNDRSINLVYNEKGNVGKSVIASLCELFGEGIDLPVVNDGEKIIQSMCNICTARMLRNPSPIFIDIPRAFNQERMSGIYSAIECIKKGKLWDLRYSYKVWWIDSPQIWVFTNVEQNLEYLSKDRWKIWRINKNLELVPFRWGF